ncbi:MAG TPA: hypothetical protein VFS20_25420 [Longimicrobium sp.]|nr:hypothetical protein [Longimicrobium sp.]
MKKLRLNVEGLRVDSFTTQPKHGATGTVRAHEYLTEGASCNDGTWGATANGCSNECSMHSCFSCTNEN